MDGAQLAAAVSRLMGTDAGELACEEPGHPAGHTCLPVSGDVDMDGLMATLTERYPSSPFTRARGLPPLPCEERFDWTHAWVWSTRAAALGRGPDGRPAVAVAERNMPRPEELPAGMSWVDRIVAVTGGPQVPVPAPDWAAIESRAGTALPGDYKRLVEVFGCDGVFDVFFRVFDPEELVSSIGDYAGDEQAAGGLPGFPLPGGLIPWSNNEHHETFFWITEGPDPDRWPVYAVDETDEGHRFEMTATEFLFRQMTDPQHPFYSQPDHIRGHWYFGFVRPES